MLNEDHFTYCTIQIILFIIVINKMENQQYNYLNKTN